LIDRMLALPEFSGVKRVPVKGLAVTGLASGQASIALQLLPELAANKDVALAGPVPDATAGRRTQRRENYLSGDWAKTLK